MNGAVLEYPIVVTDTTDLLAACYRLPGEERQPPHSQTHTHIHAQLRKVIVEEDTFARVINLCALALEHWPSSCSKALTFALHSYRHIYRFLSHEYLILQQI